MTKKDRQVVSAYLSSDLDGLYKAYGSYSGSKAQAEREIINEMIDFDGYDFRIISYNTFVFTCGYRYRKDGAEILRYHTPTDVRDISL